MFKKQILFSVTTFKMSQRILVGAKCDHDLSLRLSGVNDLIVAEGKYHSVKLLILTKYISINRYN